MNSTTFKAEGKKGGYIKVSSLPANHSSIPHFGPLDAAIVMVFLLGIGGLIYLLALN